MKKQYQLGVIGYGNMAHAILQGAIEKGVLQNEQICLFDIDRGKVEGEAFSSAKNLKELAEKCRFLLLSVKPQVFHEVLENIIFADNTLISIMAGITKKSIQGKTGCKVARIMPNTPAMIGEGMSAIDAAGLSDEEKSFVFSLFEAVGHVVSMRDEEMDLVTAVSGSGPAYVYLFADAMIQSGIRLGLSHQTAKELTLQTIVGAGKLAQYSQEELSELINKVCSKGGTTIEAVTEFRNGGLYSLTDRAMEACYRRSKELSSIEPR